MISEPPYFTKLYTGPRGTSLFGGVGFKRAVDQPKDDPIPYIQFWVSSLWGNNGATRRFYADCFNYRDEVCKVYIQYNNFSMLKIFSHYQYLIFKIM